MVVGISDVNTTYYNEAGGCAVKITGVWETDRTANHVICGCYVVGDSDYACFEWGNRFNADMGESGTFELYGMDAPEYVPGYDFYYTAGEEVDISLLVDPFDPFSVPSSIVGQQYNMVWGTCEQFCTPGHRKCVGDEVHKCNPAGTEYEYEYTCDTGYHCVNGACVEDDNGISDDIGTILIGAAVLIGAYVILTKKS